MVGNREGMVERKRGQRVMRLAVDALHGGHAAGGLPGVALKVEPWQKRLQPSPSPPKSAAASKDFGGGGGGKDDDDCHRPSPVPPITVAT